MERIVIAAPQFCHQGGWVLDTQFVPNMGMPYLLAHGLGHPVDDATTTFTVAGGGEYQVYVYTFNWVAPWKPEYAPGVFEIDIDETKTGGRFGCAASEWGWEQGGSVTLTAGEHTLRLRDLTGFEGRMGMVVLTQEIVWIFRNL